jgi:hypothetical protein
VSALTFALGSSSKIQTRYFQGSIRRLSNAPLGARMIFFALIPVVDTTGSFLKSLRDGKREWQYSLVAV